MIYNVVANSSLSTLTSRCDTTKRAFQIAKIYMNSGYSDVTVRDLNTGEVIMNSAHARSSERNKTMPTGPKGQKRPTGC